MAVGLAAALLTPQAGQTQTNLQRAVHLLEQQSRTGKGEFITFLTGAASAYRWAETQGGGATYCPPADVMLDGRSHAKMALEEYKRALSDYAKLREYPLDVLTLALLRALRGKFPCSAAAISASPAMADAPLVE